MAILLERLGEQIQANTTTSGHQHTGTVAALVGGGFVVAWIDASGVGGDPDIGIKAQVFDAIGTKVGSEFLVNTGTVGIQAQASVAPLQNGGFVITWRTGEVAAWDVKAQVFDAGGTSVGGEFLVNTNTTGTQQSPSVAALAGGGFIIAWEDRSSAVDADGTGIMAQLFDAAGNASGDAFLINTTTAGFQGGPQIISRSDGGFAATWRTPHNEIALQLFDATGAKVGGEQSVVAGAPISTTAPRIAALDSGFVVTWEEMPTPGQPTNIMAQRFDAAGASVGSVLELGTVRPHGSYRPVEVQGLAGGGFIAAWTSADFSLGGDVSAVVVNAAGEVSGTTFTVNSSTPGGQDLSGLRVLAAGDIVVVWSDYDGFSSEMAIQLLTASTEPPSDIALDDYTLSETSIENLSAATLSSGGVLNAGYGYEIVTDYSFGAFAIDGDQLIVVNSLLLDFEAAPTTQVRVRATDANGLSFEETLTIDVADAATEARYTAGEVFGAQGSDTRFDTLSQITPLASGGFLVLRHAYDEVRGYHPRVQIYDEDAEPAEDVVADLSIGDSQGAIAALSDGGFVMAFDADPDPLGYSVKVQRFDASGEEIGSEIRIAPGGTGSGASPKVAALDDGGFFVTWEREVSRFDDYDIYGQLFDGDGLPVGSEFLVNTTTASLQSVARMLELPDGGVLVTWLDDDLTDPAYVPSIKGQYFTSSGARTGDEVTFLTREANSYVSGISDMAALGDGRIVLGWVDLEFGADPWIVSVNFQIVGPDGSPFAAPVTVDMAEVWPGNWIDQRISPTPDGGFVVTWSSLMPGAEHVDAHQSWAQFFDSTGAAVGDRFLIDDASDSFERTAETTLLASGELVFGWTRSSVDDLGAYASDTYARIVAPATPGTIGTPGPDTLTGDGGDNTLLGLAGHDALNGGAGADTMVGGPGNDAFRVDSAGDVVGERAGEGVDTVFAAVSFVLSGGSEVEALRPFDINSSAPLNLTGNEFGQSLFGNAGSNVLAGGGGGDRLEGYAGSDTLIGGTGNDAYYIEDAADVVIETADEGFDRVISSVGYELEPGSEVEVLMTAYAAGTETLNLYGNEFANSIYGNTGANVLAGLGGADYLVGLDGHDTLYGGDGADALDGGAGHDVLLGGDGADYLLGGEGNDLIQGDGGLDTLAGGLGDDSYFVDGTGDLIVEAEGEGFDRVISTGSFELGAASQVEVLQFADLAGTAALSLYGSDIANSLYGNAGANVLAGGGGADYVVGLGGNDTLYGQDGADAIDGGAGSDVLFGGAGADYLVGGADGDYFAFFDAPGGGNVDQIADMAIGSDRIALDDAVFTGLAPGALPAGAFVAGTAAADADDRVIYDSASGQLWFDGDGNGAGAAVPFATVTPALALTSADFVVV